MRHGPSTDGIFGQGFGLEHRISRSAVRPQVTEKQDAPHTTLTGRLDQRPRRLGVGKEEIGAAPPPFAARQVEDRLALQRFEFDTAIASLLEQWGRRISSAHTMTF